MVLIQLQVGGINLSAALTAKTTAKDPSDRAGGWEQHQSLVCCVLSMVHYARLDQSLNAKHICDNRLKSVELEQVKQRSLYGCYRTSQAAGRDGGGHRVLHISHRLNLNIFTACPFCHVAGILSYVSMYAHIGGIRAAVRWDGCRASE